MLAISRLGQTDFERPTETRNGVVPGTTSDHRSTSPHTWGWHWRPLPTPPVRTPLKPSPEPPTVFFCPFPLSNNLLSLAHVFLQDSTHCPLTRNLLPGVFAVMTIRYMPCSFPSYGLRQCLGSTSHPRHFSLRSRLMFLHRSIRRVSGSRAKEPHRLCFQATMHESKNPKICNPKQLYHLCNNGTVHTDRI